MLILLFICFINSPIFSPPPPQGALSDDITRVRDTCRSAHAFMQAEQVGAGGIICFSGGYNIICLLP